MNMPRVLRSRRTRTSAARACIALLLIAGSAAGQVMRPRVPISSPAPTVPQETREQTAADQAAAGASAPQSDPGSPPQSDPASPPQSDPATPPPAGSPGATAPAAPSSQGAAAAAASPDASATRAAPLLGGKRGAVGALFGSVLANTNAAWRQTEGCAQRLSIAADTVPPGFRAYRAQCRSSAIARNAPNRIGIYGGDGRWNDTYVYGTPIAMPSGYTVLAELRTNGVPFQAVEASYGGGWWYAILPPQVGHTGGLMIRAQNAKGPWSRPFGTLFAKRVSVGLSDGIAWAIGEDGSIHRQVDQGEGWIEQGGCATSIANAGHDDVWVVGCDAPDALGNRRIYHRVSGTWQPVKGAAVEIAVQPDGKPWLLTADGWIWEPR